jgi:ethanolamine utilization protein EutQ (cupin superfamily)
MPVHITTPVTVEAVGTPPKLIREYAGRVATGTGEFSVARMSSPAGWSEPPQTPEFTECTVVLSGRLVVEHDGGTLEVAAGEAVVTRPGETVRYATPEGAEYVAVCVPAFAPDTVHRHEEGAPA